MSPGLRRLTGSASAITAAGVFWDAWASRDTGAGSPGLILLYLGFPVAAVGLVLTMRRISGVVPASLTALGAAGVLYFMANYPDGARGWSGAVLIGVAYLWLPMRHRFVAAPWIVIGLLGIPAFGQPEWGIIDAFTAFGAALATTSASVWALSPDVQPHTALVEDPA